MRSFILLIGLSCFFIACKQDISKEEQVLYDKVMLIHDEVMPQIKTINQREISLEKLLENTEDESEITGIKQTLEDLSAAYDLMFEWMENFKKKAKLPEGTDYMQYLKQEEVRIQKVSDDMLKSIADADAIIEKMK